MSVAEKNDLSPQLLNVLPTSSMEEQWSANATDVKVISFLRRKLICFLESSQAQYFPEYLLTYFPHNCFFDERAILLGTNGQHEKVTFEKRKGIGNICNYISNYISLCISNYLSLYISKYLCLCISSYVSLYVSLIISLSVSLILSLCVSLNISVYVSVIISLYVSLIISLNVFLITSLYMHL
jgi:hypothetical protein